MAGKVGVSADDLAKGMYLIESAGYHGADALKVLQASAEGAKVGMADQADVANALTTVLKDYHLSAADAAGVTGQMVAAVASGKMHMGDFANYWPRCCRSRPACTSPSSRSRQPRPR